MTVLSSMVPPPSGIASTGGGLVQLEAQTATTLEIGTRGRHEQSADLLLDGKLQPARSGRDVAQFGRDLLAHAR